MVSLAHVLQIANIFSIISEYCKNNNLKNLQMSAHGKCCIMFFPSVLTDTALETLQGLLYLFIHTLFFFTFCICAYALTVNWKYMLFLYIFCMHSFDLH